MNNDKKLFSVVQVVDSLYAGGAERVAIDIANELKILGHNSFLCVTRKTGPLQTELLEDVSFIELDRKSTLDIKGITRFRRFVKKYSIDIVHAHGNSSAMFCILALFGLEISIVHHDHNPVLKLRKLWMEKLILRRADLWICVSHPILLWVKENVKYSKALLINNPVDENRFSKIGIEEKLVRVLNTIVIVANYKEHKDHLNLLAAIHHYKDEFRHYQFQCYGGNTDSSYYQKVNLYKERMGLTNVELLPSNNDIPSVLTNSIIGVLSSESEGLPISLLEYMAEGLPVVVTDVGDCGRIVREAKNGIVVTPKNPKSLADGLRHLLENKQEWKAMSYNGSLYIKKYFTLAAFAEQITNQYQEIKLGNEGV